MRSLLGTSKEDCGSSDHPRMLAVIIMMNDDYDESVILIMPAGVSFTIGLLIVMMKIVTLAIMMLMAHHLRWVRVG